MSAKRVHAGSVNAQVPRHQHQIGQTVYVVRSVSVFGDAKRVVNSGMPSRRVPACGGANVLGGDAGNGFSLLWAIVGNLVDDRLKAGRVGIDEGLIVKTFGNDRMGHCGQQPYVGARFQLQMQIGHVGQPNFTRVGDDQFGPRLSGAFHLHRDDRMGFGGV